jgi:hypothetical protein
MNSPMTRPQFFMLMGIVVTIVLLIIVFGTEPVVPAGGNGPGAGYGPAPGQGQGGGSGTGAPYPTLLPRTDDSPLTETEARYISYMLEEEQLAHDLYARWAEKYTIPVFSNIAESETMHVYEVRLLAERYGLQDYPAGNATTGYSEPVIRSLYDSLEAQGDVSQIAALAAGLAIEERDIADLDMAIANTTRADVIQVWTSLRQGSQNHRSAILQLLASS